MNFFFQGLIDMDGIMDLNCLILIKIFELSQSNFEQQILILDIFLAKSYVLVPQERLSDLNIRGEIFFIP